MTGWTLRTIRDTLRAASSHRQPSAIAMACAMGLSIGLMPKDSLLVLALAVTLCLVRVNILAAILSIAIGMFALPGADGITGTVGRWLLENPALENLWHRVATWPMMPWLRWNNTVVLGSLVMGLASAIPLYTLCAAFQRLFVRTRTQSRVDAIVDEARVFQEQVREEKEQKQRKVAEPDIPIVARRRTIKKRDPQLHRIDTTIDSESNKPNILSPRPEPAKSMVTVDAPANGDSAVLHETVIEVVRYRPKHASGGNRIDDAASERPLKSLSRNITNIPTDLPGKTESSSMNRIPLEPPTPPLDEHRSESPLDSDLLPMVSMDPAEKPREEALRYLLWHLSGMHKQPRQQESVS